MYGARPLNRAIQRYLQDPLALEILEGRIQETDHVVGDVTDDGDGLMFSAVTFEPLEA